MSQETTVSLTRDDIRNRVYGKHLGEGERRNKFSKAEMAIYRKQITAIRKERREGLNKMTNGQVSHLTAEYLEKGFKVADIQEAVLQSKDKVSIVLERKKGAQGDKERADALEAKLAKVTALLAKAGISADDVETLEVATA